MPSEENEIERLRRLAWRRVRQDNKIERLRRLAGCGGRQDSQLNRHYLRDWRIYRGLSRYGLADRLDTPTWIVVREVPLEAKNQAG